MKLEMGMHTEIEISQKLSQSLTMEQLQHLNILQLSNYELENFIIEKSNENPLLTVIEPKIRHIKNLLDLSIINSKIKSYVSNEQKLDILTNLHKKEESALEFFFDQIPLHQNLSEKDIKILRYLISNLNDHYFLCLELEEVALTFNVEVSYVEEILYLLQTFEPLGVGARNIKEYLLIQIDNDFSAPPLAYEFVEKNLEEVTRLSIKSLSKHHKISTTKTKNIIDYIRSLKPLPQIQHTTAYEAYLIPDITVEKLSNEWIIHVNDQYRPSIEINQEYVKILTSHKEENYCKNCLKDIMLLMQGIEQRDRTLYSVTRLLIALQNDFFEFGLKALKPIRIKDIAISLDLHESTISRAIRNKYLKTSHGVYPFRSLFIKGITNHSGKMDSVLYVKRRINELIANETKKSPLTDQQLALELQSEGFQIARRTIAKYREELNIPNSAKRIYL